MAFLNRLFQHQLRDQPQLASYAMMYFSILVIVLVLGLVLGVMALRSGSNARLGVGSSFRWWAFC